MHSNLSDRKATNGDRLQPTQPFHKQPRYKIMATLTAKSTNGCFCGPAQQPAATNRVKSSKMFSLLAADPSPTAGRPYRSMPRALFNRLACAGCNLRLLSLQSAWRRPDGQCFLRLAIAECEHFLRVIITLGLWVDFLVKQARLDVAVVLVFVAGVFRNAAHDLMVKNLADWDTRIDADGLNGEHFQGPVAAKADIAEAGGNVHKESEAADAG